ncbi:MAG: hypothetical protein ACRBF0_02565 [Calditrichia bacterium]
MSIEKQEEEVKGGTQKEKAKMQKLLSSIRSRLNVISTTMYLLEESLVLEEAANKRYFSKMKKEMETVRQLINH